MLKGQCSFRLSLAWRQAASDGIKNRVCFAVLSPFHAAVRTGFQQHCLCSALLASWTLFSLSIKHTRFWTRPSAAIVPPLATCCHAKLIQTLHWSLEQSCFKHRGTNLLNNQHCRKNRLGYHNGVPRPPIISNSCKSFGFSTNLKVRIYRSILFRVSSTHIQTRYNIQGLWPWSIFVDMRRCRQTYCLYVLYA